MTDNQPSENKRLVPPYVSFPSFKTMIMRFKENGLPTRIDRTVLGNFSGVVGSQLLTALRFLHLIDDKNHPLEQLHALINAYNSDAWPDALQTVLKHAYAPLFDLDLQSASPGQFNERFSKTYPGEGGTVRKSVTFFLTAANEARVTISPYIMKNKKPRGGLSKRRPTRRTKLTKEKRAQPSPIESTSHQEITQPEIRSDAGSDPWLAKFPNFDPQWDEKIQQKWFEAFERLMALRKVEVAKAE